jgi:2-methylisocitrate lyase-like PEP mutase family enzyme
MTHPSLRTLLATGRLVVAPGTHDALGAKIFEKAGFEAVYMTGNGLSASLLGAPDLGMLTLSEMADRARAFARAVKVPVITDADTGYGNTNNVIRTVQEYEAAGIAAFHLEDQVTPKRCGAMAGIALISAEEHADKIRAAVNARKSPDLLVIGRSDSRLSLGFDEAIRRGQLYAEAGADLVLLEMLQSEEEIREAAQRINAPLMFNAVDGKTPPLSQTQFENLGVKLLSYPLSATLVYARAMQQFAAHLKQNQTLEGQPLAGLAISDYEAVLDRASYV